MAANPHETVSQSDMQPQDVVPTGPRRFGRRKFMEMVGGGIIGAGLAACGATVAAQPEQTGPAEVPLSPTKKPTQTPARAATAAREATPTRVRPTSTPKAVATEAPPSPTASPIVIETEAPEVRPVVITDGWNTGVPSGSGYEQAHLALSEFVANEGNLEAVGITEDHAFYSVNYGNTFSILARTENGEFYSWNGRTLAPMAAVSGKDRKLYFYRWSEVDKQNHPNDNTATGQFSIQDPSIKPDGWVKAPDGSIYFNLANEPALARLPRVVAEQPTAVEAKPNAPVLAIPSWNEDFRYGSQDPKDTAMRPGGTWNYLHTKDQLQALREGRKLKDYQTFLRNGTVVKAQRNTDGSTQLTLDFAGQTHDVRVNPVFWAYSWTQYPTSCNTSVHTAETRLMTCQPFYRGDFQAPQNPEEVFVPGNLLQINLYQQDIGKGYVPDVNAVVFFGAIFD